MRIYKLSDRIPIKIDDIFIKVAPLSLIQKSTIQQKMLEGQKANDLIVLTQAVTMALKYSLKNISGLVDGNGEEYRLVFGDDGYLTDECVDDLLNMPLTPKLTQVCATMAAGIPAAFEIEGVSFVEDSKKKM
jgi:hypothetical protein